jgi:hypothetical protein
MKSAMTGATGKFLAMKHLRVHRRLMSLLKHSRFWKADVNLTLEIDR